MKNLGASPEVSRFLLEIFAYAGKHIPHTPSRKRPKERSIKPKKGYTL
jgi:hypothetical protein